MTASHWRACAAGTALLGLVLAGCGSSTGGTATGVQKAGATHSGAAAPSSAAPSSGAPSSGAAQPPTGTAQCDFQKTPDQPAPSGKDEGVPPGGASRAGTVSVTLHTSAGDIPMTMPRSKAPCTVASFAFLAAKGYFSNSPCHRITDYPDPSPLYVLQCGDPTGTGSGGPGYTIPDENPTNLPSAPGGQGSVYARGTVAMANTGQPHSGGSQFFLVYRDSHLPPSYAVFGTVSAAGLAVLDKIQQAGITPGTDPSTGQATPNDGKPKTPVTITTATVG
jgi:peptidyl-prolyl cis-trans isomerase B (cyclophilin B)